MTLSNMTPALLALCLVLVPSDAAKAETPDTAGTAEAAPLAEFLFEDGLVRTGTGSADPGAGGPPGDTGATIPELRAASEAGDIWATYQLALAYLEGAGVDADPDEAARLFAAAVEAGNSWAMYQLGLMRLEGVGADQDATEAARLFRLAAEQHYRTRVPHA